MNGPSMAETADRHKLYEQSVQSVETEVEFIEGTFTKLRKRKPKLLREDFCGTAAAACEWVRVNSKHSAIGVDLDADVLNWGKENNVSKLKVPAQKRLKLIEDNVLTVSTDLADILVAFNFSYWVFKTRDVMRTYFKAAYKGLKDDGVFFLDSFGGSEAFEETKEKTKIDGFTYVWDQASYDPVSGDYVCHIHFRFPDGSKLKRAFSYEWRLWTLPEIRELLREAGFRKSTVYWEGSDEDGDGDGEFEPVTRGDADPAWIAYVVAEK